MIRNPSSSIAVPTIKPTAESESVRETRSYKILTALYGGGVEPSHVDPLTIVRATEVRGQLRFWWRACRSAGFADAKTLKEREGEIWGSTERPSEVAVQCTTTNPGQPEIAYSVATNVRNGKPQLQESTKLPKYATFPLQPDKSFINQIGWKSEAVRMNVSFTLQLSYPKTVEEEVKAALWAWETFGGVGARTRRGFGVIHCAEHGMPIPSTIAEAERQIRARLNDPKYVSVGTGNPDVPKLNPTMQFKLVSASDANGVWRYLIDKLNQFRQARFGTKFGLSQWPEANAIRKLNRRALKSPKSATGATTTPIDIPKFARAAFGLPIIFHLPHDRLDDHSLEGVAHDRLASPLILRPLLCQDGKALGLAAILDAPRVPKNGLRLKVKDRKDTPVTSDLLPAEARMIPPLKGNQNVLDAFLKTL